jgi:curved DNA-binding protein
MFLRVKMAKNPNFDVEGHNLVHETEVAPWEAVLGTQVSVPTADGRINIKIPAGTQNGQKLRVRGRGLPVRGGEPGDLIVLVRVQVPARVTEKEKALWAQLAKESKFAPKR